MTSTLSFDTLQAAVNEVERLRHLYGLPPIRIEAGSLLLAELRRAAMGFEDASLLGSLSGIPVFAREDMAEDEWALVFRAKPMSETGCPEHPVFDRSCEDFRCKRRWEPEGAPSVDEQLERWVKGDSVCPNKRHECCPDFSCCHPEIGWSLEKRAKFMSAGQGEREKMMMGALGDVLASFGKKAYVTRGDPTDRE